MIRTKVIATKLVPKGPITAITLFGLVFTRRRENMTKTLLNHELVHCQQQLEWLYIPFFILYGVEYLLLRLRGMSHWQAYRNISFEREAYDNEDNLEYLKKRRLWANYRKKK